MRNIYLTVSKGLLLLGTGAFLVAIVLIVMAITEEIILWVPAVIFLGSGASALIAQAYTSNWWVERERLKHPDLK